MRIKLRSMYDSFPERYGDNDKHINFYVDNNVYFLEDHSDPIGVCLLVEPRSIIPGTYTWVEEHYDRFKYVFTFDSKLLATIPNAKLLIYGQITAEFPDIPKDKNISMVCSDKGFCEGHVQRVKTAMDLQDKIDTYGKFNGGSFADDKDVYGGYRFNVCMENYSDGWYFTEKICNCFASKTIPIYWGCPHIGEFFDWEGIFYCQTADDVLKAVDRILLDPEGIYEAKREHIERNYVTVQKYRSYAKLFLQTYGSLLEGIAQ